MALLNWSRDRRKLSALALAAAIGSLAGCMLFGESRAVLREYAFSHRAHVEQELECTDCHASVETNEEPGMPRQSVCRLCHQALDAEKPPERRVETLYDGQEFRAVERGALGEEVIFLHLRHVGAGLACESCHAGIPENDDALALPVASMDACTSCHDSRAVADDCATCHTQIRAEIPPASHGGDWTFRHGGVCRAKSEAVSDRCTLCHQDTDCAACHMTTLPRDHTNQWRRVGHGLSASLDRNRCEACHRPDSCVSCHSTIEPQSHTGNFGSPMNNHCLGCHEPLRNEGCVACHASTSSHALAMPKPPDHTPAMNCRQCHIPGQAQPPMPHVDNGDNCNSCHH